MSVCVLCTSSGLVSPVVVVFGVKDVEKMELRLLSHLISTAGESVTLRHRETRVWMAVAMERDLATAGEADEV